jgi:histidinol-phosphatase
MNNTSKSMAEPMSEPKPPSPFLQFALQLAGVAAAEIMPRFQHVDARMKADGTPVTEADLEAERVMRELIQARYPDHGIMGEEHPERSSQSEFTWVLDPIDGTASFTLGIPTFGTLVALLKNGHPILGVINLPALKETIYAELGYGCWYLNKMGELVQQHVSQVNTLKNAYLSTTGLYNTDIDPKDDLNPFMMGDLIRKAGRFRFVGDCLQHALVARGLLDAALDPAMHPWDNAAIIPCILEAGGTVSDGSGSTENIVFSKSLLSSATPELHAEILSVINP